MLSPTIQPLRYVIIGVGAGIFKSHRPALALPMVEPVGMADINAEKGQACADEYGCPFYLDYKQMLTEIRPDVAVILTPPFLHASITIDCLQAGCHVLVEKPMAVQVAEADEMIVTAQRCHRLLGVILQQRFRPEIQAARKLLREGIVGQVQRVDLTAMWPRPTSYFTMASWRATWTGEGGGVLTNQASHNLDLLCYLLGSPKRLVAWTRNLLHETETEDTAHAMMEWPDGILGSVHISTAEADEDEHFKIVGTRGSLEIGRNKLLAQTLALEMHEYARVTQNPYEHPVHLPLTIELEPGQANHVAVYRSFHEAIFSPEPNYCDGVQARAELELANAIIYSSYQRCEVELPLDRPAYADLLTSLQRQSRVAQQRV